MSWGTRREKEELDRFIEEGRFAQRPTRCNGTPPESRATRESEEKGWPGSEESAVCDQCPEVASPRQEEVKCQPSAKSNSNSWKPSNTAEFVKKVFQRKRPVSLFQRDFIRISRNALIPKRNQKHADNGASPEQAKTGAILSGLIGEQTEEGHCA